MLWVRVLNGGLGPGTEGGARDPLAAHSALDPRAASHVASDLGLLRAIYAHRFLGQDLAPPVAERLRQWLEAVTLQGEPSPRSGGFDLPPLRAARKRSGLPEQLEILVSTALVELLSTGDDAVRAVSRCHGLLRGGAGGSYAPEHDQAFARLAGIEGLVGHGFCQCPQLVDAPRQGHYCSKSCSNAAFAARKGSRNPRYFAAKQAHYRERQRREAARVERAAVLFVD